MNYKEIKTYPEMNAQIVELLALSCNQVQAYAAKRIEELEAEVKRLTPVKKLGCDHYFAVYSTKKGVVKYKPCEFCGIEKQIKN